jgi:hypothetical protein
MLQLPLTLGDRDPSAEPSKEFTFRSASAERKGTSSRSPVSRLALMMAYNRLLIIELAWLPFTFGSHDPEEPRTAPFAAKGKKREQ